MKENSYIIDAGQELAEKHFNTSVWKCLIICHLAALACVKTNYECFCPLCKKNIIKIFHLLKFFSAKGKKKEGGWGVAVWVWQPVSRGWDLPFQCLNLIMCLRQNYIPLQLPLLYNKLFQFKTNLVKLGHWWIIVRCLLFGGRIHSREISGDGFTLM